MDPSGGAYNINHATRFRGPDTSPPFSLPNPRDPNSRSHPAPFGEGHSPFDSNSSISPLRRSFGAARLFSYSSPMDSATFGHRDTMPSDPPYMCPPLLPYPANQSQIGGSQPGTLSGATAVMPDSHSRSSSFQSPVGQPLPPPGVTWSFHSLPPESIQAQMLPERPGISPVTGFNQQENVLPPAFQPPSTHTSPRHSTQPSTSPQTSRHRHASFPPAIYNQTSVRLTSQTSMYRGRRRQHPSRPQRSMANRYTPADPPPRDGHDGVQDPPTGSPVFGGLRRGGARISRMAPVAMNEDAIRDLQLFRGLINTRMVASKTTLDSLEPVDIEDLPETERACVICYNEFGVTSPEGVRESPVRLPKCKHVFGERCLKVWLEGSALCPYCRDNLPAQPKRSIGSARTFLNMMSIRASHLTEVAAEDILGQMLDSSGDLADINSSESTHHPAGNRRSPPDGNDEIVRRTRQRRGNSPSLTAPPLSALMDGTNRESFRLNLLAERDWMRRGGVGARDDMNGMSNRPGLASRFSEGNGRQGPAGAGMVTMRDEDGQRAYSTASSPPGLTDTSFSNASRSSGSNEDELRQPNFPHTWHGPSSSEED